jgi:hypothetical protein
MAADGGWEARMARRSAERAVVASTPRGDDIPTVLAAELPIGEPDIERDWCTTCGLAGAPEAPDQFAPVPPCPRCGSTWRWHGRVADRDGTANGPPPAPRGCRTCYEWQRHERGQAHFGWAWWLVCDYFAGGCDHEHHKDDLWLA